MNRERVVSAVTLLILLAGCGGDDDGGATPDGGDDPAADGGGGDRVTDYVPNRVGSIELVEDGSIGTTAIAALRDKAQLPTASLLASQGECEIWTHPLAQASCDPPCADGYCAATDECVPFPVLVDAGTITVTGLTEALSFASGEFGYQPDPEFPPEDLFAADAVITAEAAGADADGFTLEAQGVPTLVADLDLEFDTTLVLEDGVDREIRWTAEDAGTIQLGVQVGWHGAAYEALLLCEADDDGSLTIPGGLVTQFPRASNGMEQHASWIARITRDTVTIDGGPVELVVASQVRIPQLRHD
ncbi:MAG TPA: hypothetical protein VMZ28_19685 [Kofleriaceae bacterium]|nr:hypothetical protein [Kofleriaceae bacterium]